MLSYEYLQKHCLAKTFNSRIENYSIHLKYRERLLDGIKHPYEFTLLKTSWRIKSDINICFPQSGFI